MPRPSVRLRSRVQSYFCSRIPPHDSACYVARYALAREAYFVQIKRATLFIAARDLRRVHISLVVVCEMHALAAVLMRVVVERDAHTDLLGLVDLAKLPVIDS